MARVCFPKAILNDPAHFPTVLLVIGYPVFWWEMVSRLAARGVTTPLAGLLVLLAFMAMIVRVWPDIRRWPARAAEVLRRQPAGVRFCLGGAGALALVYLLVTGYAASLPPHLSQEFDALNYHITLPRQHLIMGSFRRIIWAADDLLSLPVDFALAPYWLVTSLPNKFPQFIFSLGLLGIIFRWAKRVGGGDPVIGTAAALSVLSLHSVGIQMGTAMLDLVLAYLFLAALDSLCLNRPIWAGIEFGFFFWVKSYVPVQMTVLVIVVTGLIWALNRMGLKKILFGFSYSVRDIFSRTRPGTFKKALAVFMLASLFIGGPFVVKSLFYAGTPLYPLKPGMVKNRNIDYQSEAWASIEAASEKWIKESSKGYGYGLGPGSFVRHFWLIAVPEKGVNNSYDYPVGLIYLLVLAPFVIWTVQTFRRGKVPLISLFVGVYWGLWWFGSQQSRYLFLPIFGMVIAVMPLLWWRSRLFPWALLLALLLTTTSVARAHRHDWGRSRLEVLRPRDRQLLEMNRQYMRQGKTHYIGVPFHDAAFARFPVVVTEGKLPHTLDF